MFKTLKHFIILLAALSLLGAFVLGGWLAWIERERGKIALSTAQSGKPAFTLYTSQSVTSPQLPLLKALTLPQLTNSVAVTLEYWKDPESLQSLLLAGKGDLWVGHMEGFARAKKRGANLQVLAVTGWKKFYLLSNDPNVTKLEDLNGKALPYAPPGSPSVPLTEALLKARNITEVEFLPREPKELTLSIVQGKVSIALLPEPVVTTITQKMPNFKIVASIEENFCAVTGCPGRLPLAGIAINSKTVAPNKEIVEALLTGLMAAGEEFRAHPDRALAVWPAEFEAFVPKPMLEKSLQRDPIFVRPAYEVTEEIRKYLELVTPDLRAELKEQFVKQLVWNRQ